MEPTEVNVVLRREVATESSGCVERGISKIPWFLAISPDVFELLNEFESIGRFRLFRHRLDDEVLRGSLCRLLRREKSTGGTGKQPELGSVLLLLKDRSH